MKVYLLLSIGIALGFSSAGFGHARWKMGSKVSPPRENSTGLKSSPCGGVARTATPIEYKPGQQLTVEFEETINHLGYYEIRFLPANDSPAGMADNLLLMIPDNQNNPIANAQYHQFTANITLPNTKCETCTLQLIQVMQDNGPNGGDSFYYSCSDIKLVDNPQPPKPPVTPAPPPSPPVEANLGKPAKPQGLKLEPVTQGATP